MRVVVLGAGFGGLELTTRLSEEFGDDVDVVLIDQSRRVRVRVLEARRHVRARRCPRRSATPTATSSSPACASCRRRCGRSTRRPSGSTPTPGPSTPTSSSSPSAPISHPEATPGLVEGGHEFYTVAGAFALRDVLAAFEGGRVIVGVTSTPFKCPPAPSETALLLHDFLTERGLRDRSEIALVMPLGVPIPPSPAASEALLAAFAERGIGWHPERLVRALDPARKVAVLSDGGEMPYDLFLGVPVHRAPAVVEASGLTVDGWIPVDPLTLETSFPDVYAVGDVTSVGTPKAGVFAEGQAAVVADGISARSRSRRADSAQYDGRASATWSSATIRWPRSRSRSERAGTRRGARGAVASVRGRQGRVRHQPDPALVRPRVVGIRTNCSLSRRNTRGERTRRCEPTRAQRQLGSVEEALSVSAAPPSPPSPTDRLRFGQPGPFDDLFLVESHSALSGQPALASREDGLSEVGERRDCVAAIGVRRSDRQRSGRKPEPQRRRGLPRLGRRRRQRPERQAEVPVRVRFVGPRRPRAAQRDSDDAGDLGQALGERSHRCQSAKPMGRNRTERSGSVPSVPVGAV